MGEAIGRVLRFTRVLMRLTEELNYMVTTVLQCDYYTLWALFSKLKNNWVDTTEYLGQELVYFASFKEAQD